MKVVTILDKGNFNKYGGNIFSSLEVVNLEASKLNEEEVIKSGADAILVDPMITITRDVISKMPNLKIIQSFGVGFNQIDLEAAKERGIYVCNNAGVNSGAVAEQAVMLMLAVLRRYHAGEKAVYKAKQGEFKNYCFNNGLKELSECNVGLLGMGAIGKEVALRLKPFGCKVYYHDVFPLSNPEEYNVEYKNQKELFSQCDIISLHLPVLPDTVNIINDETISLMKKGVIIINTSRGELVNQEDLCMALKDGRIEGFGADTLAPEPVRADNPILALPEDTKNRIALSPHIGGITEQTFYRSYNKAFSNINAVFNGNRPSNIVNKL